MEKLFVPFVIAQMLKEKGFNLNCFTVYHGENDLYKFWAKPYDELSGDDHTTVRNSDFIKNSNIVCAPLWQQAVDWLREKKNIHITTMESDGKYIFQVKHYFEGVGNTTYLPSTNYYLGLRQAIIAGLNFIYYYDNFKKTSS